MNKYIMSKPKMLRQFFPNSIFYTFNFNIEEGAQIIVVGQMIIINSKK